MATFLISIHFLFHSFHQVFKVFNIIFIFHFNFFFNEQTWFWIVLVNNSTTVVCLIGLLLGFDRDSGGAHIRPAEIHSRAQKHLVRSGLCVWRRSGSVEKHAEILFASLCFYTNLFNQSFVSSDPGNRCGFPDKRWKNSPNKHTKQPLPHQ